MSSLSPYDHYFIDDYMGQFPFVIESKNIIGTSFNGSLENVGSTTVNIYNFVEVIFQYKRLYQPLPFLFISCLVINLFVFADIPALNLLGLSNYNYSPIYYKYI